MGFYISEKEQHVPQAAHKKLGSKVRVFPLIGKSFSMKVHRKQFQSKTKKGMSCRKQNLNKSGW